MISDLVGSKMDSILGDVDVELDGRFSAVRTSETNLGWFMPSLCVCTLFYMQPYLL